MMIEYNGMALAYLGDAIYELKIREYLIKNSSGIANDMHKMAIKYTCAQGQSKFIDSYIENLSEEELTYYKRGRNSGGSHKPKSTSLNEYRKATGFESLIGYLHLIKNEERINEIVGLSIEFINNLNG